MFVGRSTTEVVLCMVMHHWEYMKHIHFHDHVTPRILKAVSIKLISKDMFTGRLSYIGNKSEGGSLLYHARFLYAAQ